MANEEPYQSLGLGQRIRLLSESCDLIGGNILLKRLGSSLPLVSNTSYPGPSYRVRVSPDLALRVLQYLHQILQVT